MLCSLEEKKSSDKRWVNYDRILLFGWTIPLNPSLCSTTTPHSPSLAFDLSSSVCQWGPATVPFTKNRAWTRPCEWRVQSVSCRVKPNWEGTSSSLWDRGGWVRSRAAMQLFNPDSRFSCSPYVYICVCICALVNWERTFYWCTDVKVKTQNYPVASRYLCLPYT